MTQRRRLLSLCSFSFGTSVCLPLLLGQAFAAATATAPIHTHTLKPLIASAQASSKPLISFKTQSDKTVSAPPVASPSISSEEPQKNQENTTVSPASEPVSLPPQPAPESAQSLPALEASPAPVRNPLDPSESNEDMAVAQSESPSAAEPVPSAPTETSLVPLPEEAKPVPDPVKKKHAATKPTVKKAQKAKKKIKIHSPPPRQLSLSAPETREESENLEQIKQEMAVSRPHNADQSELAGVRLGMNFSQARHAVAQTLRVGLEEVKIIGTPPEAQTCTEGTQLRASSRQGSLNVQFACDARLPYAQELSVNQIAYEPDTGTIETVLQEARQKYGDPVNLDQFDPRKADFVTYYWCANPERNPASASGKDLYCTVKAGNRLRLQGRDNSLEFQLLASLKKAYQPQTESLPYDFTSDEDSLETTE